MGHGLKPPFREPPLEARVQALREERDVLRRTCDAARAAARPWSWGRFWAGVASGMLVPPALVVSFAVLAHRAARPTAAPAEPPRLPASFVAGGSPARCRVRRCDVSSVQPGNTYECAGRSSPAWDAGRAERIAWNAGTCTSGGPCEPGEECLVTLPECDCRGTCE